MDSTKRQYVIVALPKEDDPVRNVSSEKEPHLTLLYLGSPDYTSDEIDNISKYIEHASSQLDPFSLDVDLRGELGDEHADVLFFRKSSAELVETFRRNLLKNNLINKAYLSTDQFPVWTPHLTLGYPSTPAKRSANLDHQTPWVLFDRIALWTGDYEGLTFNLNYDFDPMMVKMSQTKRARDVPDILSHYGVKGMKWGVTRSSSQSSSDPDSADVVSVKASKKKIAKNSGKTDSLSNKDLQDLVTRMNLEQQYTKIKKDQKLTNKGSRKGKEILDKYRTLNDLYNLVNSPLVKTVRKGLIGV